MLQAVIAKPSSARACACTRKLGFHSSHTTTALKKWLSI